MTKDRSNVVIVGSNLSAINLAHRLSKSKKFDVSLVTRSADFVYGRSFARNKRGNISLFTKIPLKSIFEKHAKVDLIKANLVSFDSRKKIVRTNHNISYKYDSLVLVPDRQARIDNSKFDVRNTYDAYNLEQINTYRRLLIHQFENNSIQENYVVIGGNALAVKIVSDLARLLRDLELRYKPSSKYRCILIAREDRLLTELKDKNLSAMVAKQLRNQGILLGLGSSVSNFSNSKLRVMNKLIKCESVIYADRSESDSFIVLNRDLFKFDDAGMVRVSDLYEVEGYSDIYLIESDQSNDYTYDLDSVAYDARHLADILESKHDLSNIPLYRPPSDKLSIKLSDGWSATDYKDKLLLGKRASITISWRELKHFSKILPKGLYWRIRSSGGNQDEIS